MLKKSPLAPANFPEIATVSGLSLTVLQSQERYRDRDDVLVAVLDEGTQVAAVFTQSCTPGAPVLWSREVHQNAKARAMIVTAGNANVCTGKQGLENARILASATANIAGVEAEQVFVSSTGVIGEQLNIQALLDSLPKAKEALSTEQNWQAAARAIMTTDTYPKAVCVTCKLGEKEVVISGIAKGSGMIEPNMATMLSYIFTDAAIEPSLLQAMLDNAVEKSFNSITVDSDTSTSDACLLFATGQANNAMLRDASSAEAMIFLAGLEKAMVDLAQQIVKDGEGAQKFITISVSGAQNDASAKKIAKSIANSPLVKTAMAGEDANWGRIVMAVGKAGEEINFDALSTKIGGVAIAKGNGPLEDYDERLVQAHIEGREILIEVDVGLDASGSATVWTCDLTHGYIDINADYRS